MNDATRTQQEQVVYLSAGLHYHDLEGGSGASKSTVALGMSLAFLEFISYLLSFSQCSIDQQTRHDEHLRISEVNKLEQSISCIENC